MNTSTLVSKRRKIVYAALGWISVALGLAGAFLPGLPTTVFIIAASYLFAKSSPRFDSWLLSNKILGPKLQKYRENGGGMPRTAKIAALTSMWTSIAVSSAVLSRISNVAVAVTLVLGGIGTAMILFRVRTVPPAAATTQELDGSVVSLGIGAVVGRR